MQARLGLVGPGARIQGLASLTPGERRAFEDARRALVERERDDDLHRIVEGNCRDFDALLSGVTTALAQNKVSESHLLTIHMEADRRLLNVLTAMRTLLDHWSTKVSRRFGKSSRQLARFSRACSREYDRHFAYRFLWKLRNYAQHCGLPVGHIKLKSRSRVILLGRDGTPSRPMVDPARPRDEATLLIEPRTLVSEFDGWGTVRADLERRITSIDVASQVASVQRCLLRIHTIARRLSIPEARPHARYLRSLMDRVRVDDLRRVPVVYDAGQLSKRSKLTLSLHWFPLRQMRELLPRDEYVASLDEVVAAGASSP